jgi:DNA modification methylase
MIINGNNIEELKKFDDNYFDSIVTDPPYEIGFMGKSWDASGIANNPEMWAECLRVLKPGGYLLSFSATRTYHRMAVAIEDSGFEIRDMIEWVYGSGFPKSLNIHKQNGLCPEGWQTALKPAHEPICMARKPLAEKTVAENVLKYGEQVG